MRVCSDNLISHIYDIIFALKNMYLLEYIIETSKNHVASKYRISAIYNTKILRLLPSTKKNNDIAAS